MQSPAITASVNHETLQPLHLGAPSWSGAAHSHRRRTAQAQRIQAQLDDDRGLLALALASFHAELVAEAA